MTRTSPASLIASLSLSACTVPAAAPELTAGYDEREHAASFPIDDASKHALGMATFEGTSLSCSSCHDGGDTFKEFFCVRCHAQNPRRDLEDAHLLEPDYLRDDDACLSCHPTGVRGLVVPPTDPSNPSDPDDPSPPGHPYFPVEAGDIHHGDSSPGFRAREDDFGFRGCVACHDEPDDYTQTRCGDCHALDNPPMASVHGDPEVSQSYAQIVECKTCHSSTPIASPMRPIEDHGALLDDKWPHSQVQTCNECHVEAQQATPTDYALDFGAASIDCTTCHFHGAGCTPTTLDGC